MCPICLKLDPLQYRNPIENKKKSFHFLSLLFLFLPLPLSCNFLLIKNSSSVCRNMICKKEGRNVFHLFPLLQFL